MSSTSRPVARCCQCAFQNCMRTSQIFPSRTLTTAPRTSSIERQRRRFATSRRGQATAATSSGSSNAKISNIVDQIGQLTLLETADLVSTLKVGYFLILSGTSISKHVRPDSISPTFPLAASPHHLLAAPPQQPPLKKKSPHLKPKRRPSLTSH